MRLSEAIRLGAVMYPKQAFGMSGLFGDGRCAMAGATSVIGDREAMAHYREWDRLRIACPVFACPVGVAMGAHTHAPLAVIHLNDYHKLSREAIADIVEQAELASGLWSPVEPEIAEPYVTAGENVLVEV